MTMGVHKTTNMRQCSVCERHLHLTLFPWSMVLSRYRAKEGANHKRLNGTTCHYCLAQQKREKQEQEAVDSWDNMTVGVKE